jgi:hypothetical protein
VLFRSQLVKIPINADIYKFDPNAAKKRKNLLKKPASGGIPASENKHNVNDKASVGFTVARIDKS